jgi:urea transport system permease protein
VRALRHLTLAALCALAASAPARALDAGAVAGLASEESEEKLAAIRALARSGDPAALRVLQAFAADALQVAGGRVVLVEGDRVLDAATGAELRPPPEEREQITVNNRIRRELSGAIASLRLQDPDRAARLAAAQALSGGAPPALAPLLARALEQEKDPEIRALLARAHAEAALASREIPPSASPRRAPSARTATRASGRSCSASPTSAASPTRACAARPRPRSARSSAGSRSATSWAASSPACRWGASCSSAPSASPSPTV